MVANVPLNIGHMKTLLISVVALVPKNSSFGISDFFWVCLASGIGSVGT